MAARRKARRGRGRILLLNADTHESLVKSTRAGVPVDLAAEAAGVSRTAFMEWLSKGRDEDERLHEDGAEPDPSQAPFLALWEEIRQARAEAAQRNMLTIQRVAQGGTVVEVRKETMPDGTHVETEKRQPPDWRAAAWYLERQHANHFSKEAAQVEVSGPGGGPLEIAHVDVADLAARISANVAAIAAGRPELEAADDDVTDAEIVDDTDA